MSGLRELAERHLPSAGGRLFGELVRAVLVQAAGSLLGVETIAARVDTVQCLVDAEGVETGTIGALGGVGFSVHAPPVTALPRRTRVWAGSNGDGRTLGVSGSGVHSSDDQLWYRPERPLSRTRSVGGARAMAHVEAVSDADQVDQPSHHATRFVEPHVLVRGGGRVADVLEHPETVAVDERHRRRVDHHDVGPVRQSRQDVADVSAAVAVEFTSSYLTTPASPPVARRCTSSASTDEVSPGVVMTSAP
jgi:hypothetical protein